MASAQLPSTRVHTEQDGRRSVLADAFGLTDDPFGPDPAGTLFVATDVHRAARETLDAWIGQMWEAPSREDRLAVVTGEEGSGKTALLAELSRVLANDPRYHLVILPETPEGWTEAQLLKTILVAFGAEPAGRTGFELRGEIRTTLQRIRSAGTQPALLIDGADFKGSHLELIRNLLRDAEGTGFWVILSGTPDLYLRMSRRRSLRGLMGPTVVLDPLDAADLDRMLDARIDAVRGAHTPDALFQPGARAILHTWSEGNARRIIRIAGEALAAAATTGQSTVTPEIARQVVRSLTIAEANEARAETPPTAEPGAIQAPIPLLLDGTPVRSSSATTQQALWDEEPSS